MLRVFYVLVAVALLAVATIDRSRADSVSSPGGIQAIPVGPGLGTNPTVFNPGTGGSQQSVVSGSPLYLQNAQVSKTAAYVLNSDLGGISDTARIIKANGAASIPFTAPNPVGTLAAYTLADQSGKGYTVTTVGGSATFYGCVSPVVTTLTVPPNQMALLSDDGTNYFCTLIPQFGTLPGLPDTLTSAITATGTSQSAAAALPSQFDIVSTASGSCPLGGPYTSCNGVVLGSAVVAGDHQLVCNRGALNGFLVYPSGTGAIMSGAPGIPVRMEVNSCNRFTKQTTGVNGIWVVE